MNFTESVEYLYSLGNEVTTMKLGLESIRRLLAALGNPQNNFLKIQIAGTNGKGSTCAFLDAICVSAGIKTGLYTSPHLVSTTERIKIGGREISEKDFAKHATRIRETSEKLVQNSKFKIQNSKFDDFAIDNWQSAISLETVPTFFEQMTAIALSAFAEAKIELAILETGLGGRFDATTAARAEIAAITPIDFDHQDILGDTIEEIAAEKAAIIREDTKTVITANQTGAAAKIIFERCDNFGIAPKTTNFKSAIGGKSGKNLIVDFQTEKAEYKNVRLNLLGKHQIENSKTAILLAETLQENFPIKIENIIAGLQSAKHKGRLEFCENILFDGAHNAAGAKALREFLDEFITQPVTMIFGAMRDKDLTEIAAILFPKADKIIFTVPDNPRSMSADELMKFLPENFRRENIFETENVKNALEKAWKISSENHLILVTGSLYLVGEARKILNNKLEI